VSETGESGEKTTKSQESRHLDEATETASTAVRQAADVLEEQLSAGLVGVRKVTAGFAENQHVDQDAFNEVIERLRSSAHEVLDAAFGRVSDLGAQDARNLTERFARDAHSVFDAVIDVATVAPSIVNRLVARPEQASPSDDDH
jgi:hypothetical protein